TIMQSACAQTAATETSTQLPYALSGDIIVDLAMLGVSASNATIMYRPVSNRSARKHNVSVRLNVNGKEMSCAAQDYRSLIIDIKSNLEKKHSYYLSRKRAKKERYILRFIDKYRDSTILPVWLM
ncbi:MAG: hypothetical protein WCQ86_06400, partial [Bacteroidaceae bacterium]